MKLLFAITMLYITSAFSQITVTADNIPVGGVTYTLHHAAHEIEVDHGNPGPNQTWSFLDYEWMEEEIMEIEPAEDSPFAEDFPTATRVNFFPYPERHDDGSYYYERIAANGYFVLGFGNLTDTDTLAYPYVGESLRCPLPLSYSTPDWTTVNHWWYSFNPGDTVVVIDSLLCHVDGWGTVTTAFGSYPCLRIFHHDWFFTYLPGAPPVEIEEVGYRWVDEYCVERATVDSEADTTNPDFEIGHLHVTSDALDVPHVRGPVARTFSVSQNYPNPFNPTTNLPVNVIASGELSLRIYNETGQLVSEEKYSFSPGQHELPIDGSKWSTGTYFANVSNNGLQTTTKMQLVR